MFFLHAVPGADGQFWVRNAASGLCLDVSEARSTDGTEVIQYPCHDVPNQRFVVKAGTDRFASLSPVHRQDKCLDMRNASLNNGAVLQIWGCGDAASHQSFQLGVAP
jgi:hypothetical protein